MTPSPAIPSTRRALRWRGVSSLATNDPTLSEATAQAWIRELDGPNATRPDRYEEAPVERSA